MLLDTQVLFGLREKDEYHEIVRTLLESKKEQLHIATVTCLELKLVMQGQGKSNVIISEFMEILQDIMIQYGIDETQMSIVDLRKSLELRAKYPHLTFFDSIIIATAINSHLILVGDDKIYDNIIELDYKRLRDFDVNI